MRSGARTAREIRDAIARNPGLTHISVVGNSLGGLYSRYAVRELHTPDEPGGAIAGLQPVTFMVSALSADAAARAPLSRTIATPHLGVRRYTWGITQYPKFMFPLAKILFGQSGKDLFLTDAEERAAAAAAGVGEGVVGGGEPEVPLLMKMASDEEFLAPLRTFKRRRAYANMRGDFMVTLRTAAIEPHPIKAECQSQRAHEWLWGRASGVIVEQQDSSSSGAPVAVPAAAAADDSKPVAIGADSAEQVEEQEEAMARALNALGWTKASAPRADDGIPDSACSLSVVSRRWRCREIAAVARATPPPLSYNAHAGADASIRVIVDFGAVLVPGHHNSICAHSANPWTRLVNKAGRNIMDHAAAYLLDIEGQGGADAAVS
ncbi:putative serine esterase-domain-containing protein [Tribonema minus]|uniref:Putative serine esterase-domain-containing protein n=1 Tax=Tribonema minus TaxID=303371 RepID=A0A835ZCP2_9STRA|nr:putative serine esterase-domain-containing protein [Tribonema minus]